MYERQKKRERGANYTPEEKSLLMELVAEYKHILENKNQGGIYIKQKREVWRVITMKYNSNATTGVRETDQLKALYDNLKQKSRRSNMKDVAEIKVEMNEAGGGCLKAKITDTDDNHLSIEVDPLINPYDSASAFFGEDQEVEDGQHQQHQVSIEEQNKEDNDIEHSLKTSVLPQKRIIKSKQGTRVQKKTNSSSADALKRLYFKRKCLNAALEHKKLLQELLLLKKKHREQDLKMFILKSKMDNDI